MHAFGGKHKHAFALLNGMRTLAYRGISPPATLETRRHGGKKNRRLTTEVTEDAEPSPPFGLRRAKEEMKYIL
ncbi:MAG: hypothetical protein ACI9OU_002252 [Candidatus Promineifilaceae bacterium]|jgi:hypothetical protein